MTKGSASVVERDHDDVAIARETAALIDGPCGSSARESASVDPDYDGAQGLRRFGGAEHVQVKAIFVLGMIGQQSQLEREATDPLNRSGAQTSGLAIRHATSKRGQIMISMSFFDIS